jgi:hypothetical protein
LYIIVVNPFCFPGGFDLPLVYVAAEEKARSIQESGCFSENLPQELKNDAQK